MNTNRLNVLGLLFALSAMAACASMGTGVGSARNGDTHANFTWKSTDDRTGTLNASLTDGKSFSGPYFQVTHDSRIDTLEPLWSGWNERWYGWPEWGPVPDTAFITHYTGRVVANLADADGDHMRCHFRLTRPSRGMAGGGQGACQLPSGETIDATFAQS
ncbi:MAG TPA: hypothetical protein VKB34_11825 [Povalibacter sp.]|nr:hypothetical protein [Povalibacter sp.]